MTKSNKLELCGAIMLAFTALVCQVFSASSTIMTKLQSIYNPWMLLAMLLGIIYTSLLQSTVVVPESRTEDLPMEKLIQLNYSIFSSQAPALRRLATHLRERTSSNAAYDSHAHTAMLNLTRKIQNLGQRVRDAPDITIPFLLEMSHNERKVLLESRFTISVYSKMLRALNSNAARGKDRLLELPFLWHFQTPKAFMLVRLLEHLKASGLVSHFMEQGEEALAQHFAKKSSTVYMQQASIFGRKVRSGYNNSRVGLSDSVLRESLAVLAYGLWLSVFVFVLEVLDVFVRRIYYAIAMTKALANFLW